MSRSSWKGFYINEKLMRLKGKEDGHSFVQSHSRSSVLPDFIANGKNVTVALYNGKTYKTLSMFSREHLGFKLGEFGFTRRHNVSEKALRKRNKGAKGLVKKKK